MERVGGGPLWPVAFGAGICRAGLASLSPVSSWSAHSFFLRLCSEVPILEDTLMRILVIGLSRELPLGPADAMELADHLVKRAAAVQADGACPWGVSWPSGDGHLPPGRVLGPPQVCSPVPTVLSPAVLALSTSLDATW